MAPLAFALPVFLCHLSDLYPTMHTHGGVPGVLTRPRQQRSPTSFFIVPAAMLLLATPSSLSSITVTCAHRGASACGLRWYNALARSDSNQQLLGADHTVCPFTPYERYPFA